MEHLDLSPLSAFRPGLPQREFLFEVAASLWSAPEVHALWLGGSLATGAADAHSDVDLRVAVTPDAFVGRTFPTWAQVLAARVVARQSNVFGEGIVLHHILLANGQIYDLLIYSTSATPYPEHRLLLGCRDEAFAGKLAGGADPAPKTFVAADPMAVHDLIAGFWLQSHKHLKVLHRDLPLVAWFGETHLRQLLLRLYYIHSTGNDCGPLNALNIHGLTGVIRLLQQACGETALRVAGGSQGTREEQLRSLQSVRDEVSRVGYDLAKRLGFEYPAAAEAVVRTAWTSAWPCPTPEHA